MEFGDIFSMNYMDQMTVVNQLYREVLMVLYSHLKTIEQTLFPLLIGIEEVSFGHFKEIHRLMTSALLLMGKKSNHFFHEFLS